MHLVVAIPDQADFTADLPAAWWLLGDDGAPLRDGNSRLADAPRAERVIVTIPASRIIFIETPLPPVTGERREALVRYAIEDKLTIDPSTVHAIVVGKSTSDEASANHVVAAIDRSWLRTALGWLDAAGFAPVAAVADTEAIATAPAKWTLLINTAHGYAKRSDGLVYSFDTDLSGEPPFALSLALREARSAQSAPNSLSLHAGDVSVAPQLNAALAARWANSLQTIITLGAANTAAERNRLLVTGKSARQSSFLTGEFAPRSSGTAWVGTLKPAMIALGVIVAAQFLFTVLDWWRLERQSQALNQQMIQVFRTAFPQAQAIVDPSLQLKRNLDQLKRERGLVADDPARAQLARLAEIVRGIPQIKVTGVELSGGTATLRGEMTDASAAPVLQQRAGAAQAQLNIAGDKNVVLVLKGTP